MITNHARTAAALGAAVGSIGAGAYGYSATHHTHHVVVAQSSPVIHAHVLSAQVAGTSSTIRANTNSVQLVSLPGFTEHALTIGGQTRHYYLQLPPNATGPVPMVIALHGLNSSPGWIAENTGLAAACKQANIALAVPVTVNGAWNDGRLGPNGPDDQSFLLSIAQAAVANKIADPNRLIITGFSNGAEMSLTMASLYPHTFAAVVSVSGELPAAKGSARPTAPVPMYFTHGMNDHVQPYDGRTSNGKLFNSLLSEDQTVNLFVASNHAGAPTEKHLPKGPAATGPIQELVYPAKPGGASVTLYKIPGVGHKWPAAATHKATNDSVVPAGFDATALIVRVASTIKS